VSMTIGFCNLVHVKNVVFCELYPSTPSLAQKNILTELHFSLEFYYPDLKCRSSIHSSPKTQITVKTIRKTPSNLESRRLVIHGSILFLLHFNGHDRIRYIAWLL
jgi:hypothetical protein